ncbi:hypothetical protein [Pseudovibrio exalbescens]|uniref:Flagellar assembly protein FliH/Type III secretion system HrpE domain-containing protein n=1 Tax=Pseudovibrio exalbescens TaxID=197461 RepID=A0A1U7JEI7_9HYPH|nr:hypothetical protein [Pseudovibrio exalbescens]OKL43092.1 hypothetical protein A3843_15295 [Pseudovibrio exalbescens]
MTKALADTLADFTDATERGSHDPLELNDVVAILPKAYGEGGDWVGRVFEAYENGFSEGEESKQAECDARIEEMKKELDEKFVTTQKAWKEEQGRILEEQVKQALAGLEEKVSAAVAEILIPFLHDQAREKAISTLSQVLRRHLSDNREAVIEVKGPKDLHDLFERTSGDLFHLMNYTETEGGDLEVRVGEMTLSSGLSEWISELHAKEEGKG